MSAKEHTSPLLKVESIVTIALFCIAIVLPLIEMAFDFDPAKPIVEKRTLADKPKFTWAWSTIDDYPEQFEDYFQDHIGFRDFFIRSYNIINVLWLRTPPSTRVMLGKDDWLFLGGTMQDYYRGVVPYTTREIARIARILEERRVWLAERNTPLLYIFTPVKCSVYPENVSTVLNKVDEKNLLDHLLDYLDKWGELDYIDLRHTLLDAKGDHPLVYQRSGTHWNDLGAYLSYLEIAGRLNDSFPEVTPLQQSDLEIFEKRVPGYDLADMLTLIDHYSETQIFATVKNPASVRVDDVPLQKKYFPRSEHFAMERTDVDLPRAVMFRDSFADGFIPFLSENFQRIAYVFQPVFDAGVIEKENPDIVMHQMIERSLLEPWPPNPLEISNPYLQRIFDESKDVRFTMKEPLQISGKIGTLNLPVSLKSSPSLLIARVEVNCPKRTTIRLTYRVKEFSKWRKEKFFTDRIRDYFKVKSLRPNFDVKGIEVAFELPAGQGVHYIPIDAADLLGEISISGAKDAETIEIQNVEVRNTLYPYEMDRAD